MKVKKKIKVLKKELNEQRLRVETLDARVCVLENKSMPRSYYTGSGRTWAVSNFANAVANDESIIREGEPK